jgi:peptidyl-prolyl cis-trans isomerase C
MRGEKMRLILGLFIIVFLLGCENIPFLSPKKTTPKKTQEIMSLPVKGTIIAKVNNLAITLEDLNAEIANYNALVQDKPELKITTREQRVNYLKNEMVRRALLYQEALDRGLDKKEEVLRDLEKAKMELSVVELIREETAKIEVSSKEIEDYYNTYKGELKEPEERNMREIVVPIEQEAKDILIQLLQGANFATLAKERSKSLSAKDGGDLGFISKGKKFSQFDAVAFSDTLDVGGISNIFKGPEGYYILKLEEKRGGRQKSLSDLWDDIKRGLTFLKQQQKVEEIIRKQTSSGTIEINEGKVE